MSIYLRIILVVISMLSMMNVMKRVRRFKLVAVFPDPMFWLADLLGIQSPANMVFLFVIFILLIKTFNLTLEISQLQYKIQELVQKIALDENKKNKEADKEEK